MDKRRDSSGGGLVEQMKNGEGTCVKGGLVGKCLVSGSKDWKVIVRLQDFCKGDVYGNVYKVCRTPTHIDTFVIRTVRTNRRKTEPNHRSFRFGLKCPHHHCSYYRPFEPNRKDEPKRKTEPNHRSSRFGLKDLYLHCLYSRAVE